MEGDEAQLLLADLGGVFVGAPPRTVELCRRCKDEDAGKMGDGG